ncbi:hypothetical protein Taro_044667 [Colocasia esculenta]|uniref:Uncharacterized protein n=1 Tax=Colocasia esculenta TaxID=4460 RepID=A0A843WV54_COLES|nr:hypothetical protein [Colocasia esculenta]
MAKLSSSSSSSNSHHLGHLPLWLISALRTAKMEGKASGLLKQVRHLLPSFVKAKLAAVKSKTSAVKTQLIIFGLLHNRKVLMSAISDKIHTLISSQYEKQEAGAAVSDDGICKMTAQHNAPSPKAAPPPEASEICTVESAGTTAGRDIISMQDMDYYPDLISHSLNFDDDVGGGNGTESVIDLVKKSQREDQGEFVLEEEIDQVAELFIKRFRRQMMLERLESFRRHQEGGA